MRFGVLTGGGDCPGLNAVIRAVVRKGVKEYGDEFIGFRDGWRGTARGFNNDARYPSYARNSSKGRNHSLVSSRTNPFKIDGGVEKIKANLEKHGRRCA
jgi:6-phosphofructokinase 1